MGYGCAYRQTDTLRPTRPALNQLHLKDPNMTTTTTTDTCATCINFADAGYGLECFNAITFRKRGATESTPAQAHDTCPDHDPKQTELMSHPDGIFRISIERVREELFECGILRVTDEHGVTVSVELGGIGLIELGVDLIRHGKEMVE